MSPHTHIPPVAPPMLICIVHRTGCTTDCQVHTPCQCVVVWLCVYVCIMCDCMHVSDDAVGEVRLSLCV